jgi:hypothetical protein
MDDKEERHPPTTQEQGFSNRLEAFHNLLYLMRLEIDQPSRLTVYLDCFERILKGMRADAKIGKHCGRPYSFRLAPNQPLTSPSS